MELLTIILVNLIVLFLIYVVLSIRFSRAVEKIRKGGVPRELYDNLRTVIQISEENAEIANEKSKQAYKMLKEMQAMKDQIEAQIAELKKLQKKNKTSKISKKSAAKTNRTNSEIPDAGNEPDYSKPVTYGNRNRKVVTDIEESPIDRLIPESDTDRFETNASSSSQVNPFFSAKESRPVASKFTLERIGRGIRKFFNIKEIPAVSRPPSSENVPVSKNPKESKLKETTEQLLKTANESQKNSPENQSQEQRLPFAGELKRMVERTAEEQAEPVENHKTQPENTELQAYLETNYPDWKKMNPRQTRIVLIKLIKMGFDLEQIAATFNMTISELELLSSLEQKPKKYRT